MPSKDKLPLKPVKAPKAKVAASDLRVKTVRLSRARRAAILKALADPRRLELLERIARSNCPLGCAAARATLTISAATLSHHIKELENAGLVHVEREGKYIYLSLKSDVWSALVASLTAIGQAHRAD
jgi:ArsR family transcriptional regulator